MVDRDLSICEDSLSPSCTSSNDVVDIRLAMSDGDLSGPVVPSPSSPAFRVGLSFASPVVKSGSTAFDSGDWSARAAGFERREV